MYSKSLVVAFLLAVSLIAGNRDRSQDQNQPPTAQGPNMQEKRFAVDLVRAINTAEMRYTTQETQYLFASWNTLAASPGFKEAVEQFSRSSPKLRDLNLSTPSNVLAGWQLRLALAPGSKSYVIVLVDTNDKECSFAVVSDEGGIIREARAIGCSAH
jgi:hypothetical protein